MPQETLGYVEMEWTCRRCGTKNPGLQKVCQACGAQMDSDQAFEAPAEQALIKDAARSAQTGKGPDRHCPFCGTRNPGDAKACSRCGGDLTKAEQRQAGQTAGAFQPGSGQPAKCPACGTENPAGAARCSACGQPLGAAPAPAAPAAPPAGQAAPAAPARRSLAATLIGGAALLVCLLAGGCLVFQSLRTTDVVASVQGVHWERSIAIEAQVPVEHEAWQDAMPAQATPGACELKPRLMQDSPDPVRRSDKVCGTAYMVDQGDGTSKVVQDCQYQVYDQYCAYTVLDWREVDRASAQGDDLNPYWPEFSLMADQREGQRQETYSVTLAAPDRSYEYSAPDAAAFAQFLPESRWTLKVNGLGGLNAVEPVR